MKIDHLIWSRAVVTLDDDVLSTIQQHVQAVYHENTKLLHLRMYISFGACQQHTGSYAALMATQSNGDFRAEVLALPWATRV